jgi:hypothetical protein
VRFLLDGADSGVAQEVSHPTSVSKTVGEGVDATLFSDTAFGTGSGLSKRSSRRSVNNGRY